MTVMGETPEQVAHTLAFLQFELNDAAFHQHALAGATGFHEGVRALVRDGIAAGELIRCDAGRLARALQATLDGSVLGWTIHRKGAMAAWIRRDLRVVLGPYCT